MESWAVAKRRRDVSLGIDYQHPSGLFAGGWAANVDYEVEVSYDEPREIVADLYVGYHRSAHGLVVDVPRSADTCIQTPGFPTITTRSARRSAFAIACSTRPHTATSSIAGSRSALNQELSFALPLRGDIELGGTLGRFALSGSDVDYTHWNLGVSKVVRSVVLDLRYYKSGYDWLTYRGDPNANQYVLSVSYALRGKRSRI